MGAPHTVCAARTIYTLLCELALGAFSLFVFLQSRSRVTLFSHALPKYYGTQYRYYYVETMRMQMPFTNKHKRCVPCLALALALAHTL